MEKRVINPPTLFDSRPSGFSQIVTVIGGTTIYISGQVAWDTERKFTATSFREEVWQAYGNLEVALEAAGATLDDVVSLRIYFVDYDDDKGAVHQEAMLHFFDNERPPTSNWIGVAALASPIFSIEIEAVAVIE